MLWIFKFCLSKYTKTDEKKYLDMKSESIEYDNHNLAWINTQLETNHIHIISEHIEVYYDIQWNYYVGNWMIVSY